MGKLKLEEVISSRSARRNLYFFLKNSHLNNFVAVFLCLIIVAKN